MGAVAYRVLLPVDSNIHNVFHVSQLKPVIGSHHSVSPLPTSFSVADEVVIEPESIVDTRYDAQGHLEALVSWSGIPDHENSWERVSELLQQFPRLKLEGKLLFVPADIDKPLRAYVRQRMKRADVEGASKDLNKQC